MTKTRRKRRIISIDDKIIDARQLLEKAKARYEAAVANLKKLMDKREKMRQQELMAAISKSDRTYEEIRNFIKG